MPRHPGSSPSPSLRQQGSRGAVTVGAGDRLPSTCLKASPSPPPHGTQSGDFTEWAPFFNGCQVNALAQPGDRDPALNAVTTPVPREENQ